MFNQPLIHLGHQTVFLHSCCSSARAFLCQTHDNCGLLFETSWETSLNAFWNQNVLLVGSICLFKKEMRLLWHGLFCAFPVFCGSEILNDRLWSATQNSCAIVVPWIWFLRILDQHFFVLISSGPSDSSSFCFHRLLVIVACHPCEMYDSFCFLAKHKAHFCNCSSCPCVLDHLLILLLSLLELCWVLAYETC